MSQDTKVESVPREIIESEILVSLSEGEKVAVIMGEEELDLVILALETSEDYRSPEMRHKAEDLVEDLKKLKEGAFE